MIVGEEYCTCSMSVAIVEESLEAPHIPFKGLVSQSLMITADENIPVFGLGGRSAPQMVISQEPEETKWPTRSIQQQSAVWRQLDSIYYLQFVWQPHLSYMTLSA